MKLFRWGHHGAERPGVVAADGTLLDVSAFGEDFGEPFFGSDGPRRLRAWLAGPGRRAPRIAAGEVGRYGSAVCRPSKIICIGLNYVDHARETGAAIPTEPVIFFKSSTALAGPNDDLPLPRGATKVDWEVELAFVVGRTSRHVAPERALEHVAGFVLHNDYSERAFQLERGGQWSKGKSCDGFAPLGPWLVTPDELPGFRELGMWLDVNGKRRQTGNTRNMIFDVPTLLSYVSGFMTLLPGDVISTGTPPGVGLAMDPPTYLVEGDEVECGIDGLGSMRQRIVASATAPAPARQRTDDA